MRKSQVINVKLTMYELNQLINLLRSHQSGAQALLGKLVSLSLSQPLSREKE